MAEQESDAGAVVLRPRKPNPAVPAASAAVLALWIVFLAAVAMRWI